MWTYSLIWMKRNVAPSSSVVSSPACMARRLPDLAPVERPVHGEHEESRIAVLTPATATGSSCP